MPEPYVNLENAHLLDQRHTMERIQNRGECPFCWENLQKEHKKPILRKGRHWLVTPIQWEYQNAKLQLLIISRAHVVRPTELRSGAWKELLAILRWIDDEFAPPGGGFAGRFGDTVMSGATVNHLHFHLIVPRKPRKRTDYAPVTFFIGARKPTS